MLYILLFIIGLFGGLIAGLLGVGGGIIFTPVLFFLFDGNVEHPVLWTIATSLLCTFFAAIGSTRKHARMKNLFIRESLLVGFFGLFGTTAGKWVTLSNWYSQTHFVLLFSGILFYSAFNFFKGKKKVIEANYTPESNPTIIWYQALFIGGAGGLLATLAGVGGGMIMIPIMVLLLGLQFRKAVSISSFVIVIISLSAWIQFTFETPTGLGLTTFTLGYVDFGTAIPFVLGALTGSGSGVWLTGKVKIRKLEIVFAVLALIVGVRMVWGLF